MNLEKMQEILKEQVQKEYTQGYEHVRAEIERKKDVITKLIAKDLPNGTIRVNLLYKNIKLSMALYLTDNPTITFTSKDGVLSAEKMRNAELVREYDDDDLNVTDLRRKIIYENGLYGVSVTTIDGFDTEEQQPLFDSIHPLSIIPDPKNWTGSYGRFFGFTRRISEEAIRNNSAYKIPEIIERIGKDANMSRVENMTNTLKIDDDGLCDVYDHYTTHNGVKYLTTWINERSTLIRCVEIGKCSEREKRKPQLTKYPIQIHRRCPLYGSFYGTSIADEVLQYQDPISILTNLQLIQARISALGPDKFVNVALGIDVSMLQDKPIGGRIIPVNPVNGTISQNIAYDIQPNPSQFPSQMVQELEQRAEGNTGATALAFGQSLSGSQTKAEVQTLMQNTNQLLLEEKNNYMRGEAEFWKDFMQAYELYMPSRKKKNIALYKNGSTISRTLKKSEFVTDGKINITIESKSDIKKRNEADYAKLNAAVGHILPNIKNEYAMNELLRKILDTLDIYDMDSKKYIPESIDEMKAKMKLELLNQDIELEGPVEGEDFMTYINIYKTALPTKAREKILEQYMQAYMNTPKMDMMQQGQADATSSAMAMNIVNSNLANPNTSIISQK